MARPKTHGSPWKSFEDALIRAYVARGLSARAISEVMPTRSFKAISARMVKLGLRNRVHVAWTPEEDKRLHELCESGRYTLAQIAAQFPTRGEGSVQKRMQRLGLVVGLVGRTTFSLSDVVAETGASYSLVRSVVKRLVGGREDPLVYRGHGAGRRWALSLDQYLRVVRQINKRRHGRGWTSEEDEQLQRLAAQGNLSAREIGARLRRTQRAVFRRADVLGILLDQRRDWTPAEERRLLELHEQGYTPLEIAEQLDRSRSAVYNKLTQHGIHRRSPKENWYE